jgi:hypothetical protein
LVWENHCIEIKGIKESQLDIRRFRQKVFDQVDVGWIACRRAERAPQKIENTVFDRQGRAVDLCFVNVDKFGYGFGDARIGERGKVGLPVLFKSIICDPADVGTSIADIKVDLLRGKIDWINDYRAQLF